jgi:1-acyl-sn-glycerol-3-phosphate acyltransferase
VSASTVRDGVPEVSATILAWFTRYARRYCRGHFHAVRLVPKPAAPDPAERPLIVVMNHPSWWDPMMGLVLAAARFPGWRHYAPIDADALARYRFLGKIGLFPVERDTARGAASFLRTSRAILARPRATLWITAQGRFTDPRERPPGLQAGIGHLAHRADDTWILPLAVEYPFWDERTPEALLRFGQPLHVRRGADHQPAQWTALVEEHLGSAQEALAILARRRDPAEFETLIGGTTGVGGVYDLWRRLRARLRGERFSARHGRGDA